MRKIKLWVETGYENAHHSLVIEVPDDIPDEVLNEMAETYMYEHIDYGWEEVDGN